MKTTIVLGTATALLMAISFACTAQPGPHPPLPPQQQGLQKVTAFTGKMGAWVNNDDYVYDGFYLQTDAGKLLVKFPAHLGSQLTAIQKAGSSITVNGVEAITPLGEKEIRMVSIAAGGQTINDTPTAPPATPPAEELISGSAKISELQKGKGGEVNGFVLDNKAILKVPPHLAMQLSQLAVAGTIINYSGIKKTARSGEVLAANYTIIHCQTISINGTQYLTR